MDQNNQNQNYQNQSYQNQGYGFYGSQQPFGSPNGGFEPPIFKDSAYYRSRARQMLKGKWVNTSVLSFLVSLIAGIGAIVGVVVLYVCMFGAAIGGVIAENEVAMVIGFAAGFVLFFVILIAASIFLGGPLTVGMYRHHLRQNDGETPPVGDLFSVFSKGLFRTAGLYARYMIRVSVLGAAVMIGSVILAAILGVVIAGLSELLAGVGIILAVFLGLAGYFVGFALLIVQSYRYQLTFLFAVDHPEWTSTQCLDASRNYMQGNKWRLFCLQFSFIGWYLLMFVATLLTCGIAGYVAPYVLQSYTVAATTAFYDDVTNRAANRASAEYTVGPDDYTAQNDTRYTDL